MNIQSASNAAEFVHCVNVDSRGRIKVALVPGHEAKIYEVKFSRYKETIIIESCTSGQDLCKGNVHGICYHALAALMYSANKHGLEIYLSDNSDGVITSRASNKSISMSYREKKNERRNCQEQSY